MAQDYEKIDSLGIEISVNKEASASAKNIDKVANALEHLQSAVASLDLSTLNSAFASLEKLANVQFKGVSSLNKTISNLKNVNERIQQTAKDIRSKLPQTEIGGEKKADIINTQQGERTKKTFSFLDKIIKKINNKSKDATKNFGKLFRSVGRIAFYRTIRKGLQLVTQSFTQGLQNIASSVPEVNNTMSEIKSSFALVQNSLGSLAFTFLNTFKPAIQSVTQGFTNFINNLNKVIAVSAGADYYYEAADAVRDYDKAMNKLSFDQFESLGGNQEDSFKKVSLKNEDGTPTDNAQLSESQQRLKDIFDRIGNIFSRLKNIYDQIKPSLENIFNTILDIIDGVTKFIDWLGTIKITDDISLLDVALWGIVVALGAVALANIVVALTNPFTWIIIGIVAAGAAIYGLAALLTKFADNIKNFFIGIANGIVSFLEDLVNGMIMFLNIPIKLINNIIKGANKLPFVNIPLIPEIQEVEIPRFATGGLYETGDYFKANENGVTEMIASSNHGGGAVMNLGQWQKISEQSFYNALAKYGASRGDLDMSGFGLYMDEKKVGQAVENSVYTEGIRVGHFKKVR